MSDNSEEMFSKEEKKQFEDYKTLTFWNSKDYGVTAGYDKIFIPLSIAAPAYILLKGAEQIWPIRITLVGSLILLVCWFLLTRRYSKATVFRFKLMQDIERCLGLNAHLEYQKYYETTVLRDFRIRISFFCTMILAYVILFTLSVCGPEKFISS